MRVDASTNNTPMPRKGPSSAIRPINFKADSASVASLLKHAFRSSSPFEQQALLDFRLPPSSFLMVLDLLHPLLRRFYEAYVLTQDERVMSTLTIRRLPYDSRTWMLSNFGAVGGQRITVSTWTRMRKLLHHAIQHAFAQGASAVVTDIEDGRQPIVHWMCRREGFLAEGTYSYYLVQDPAVLRGQIVRLLPVLEYTVSQRQPQFGDRMIVLLEKGLTGIDRLDKVVIVNGVATCSLHILSSKKGEYCRIRLTPTMPLADVTAYMVTALALDARTQRKPRVLLGVPEWCQPISRLCEEQGLKVISRHHRLRLS